MSNVCGVKTCVHENMSAFTNQMAKWYRASASGLVDLGFDSELGQTNDCKIGMYSFPL